MAGQPMGTLPEDDFRRDRDPLTARRASVVGLAAVVALLIAAAALWFSGRQPPAGSHTGPTAAVAPRTPLPVVATPVPRQPVVGADFTAVGDPASRQLIVVGGIDSYDTTWVWSGGRWSLARAHTNPPGRFRAAAAYDPLTRTVLLYGGRLGPGQVVNDTWEWNGVRWRQLDDGTGSPPPGEGSLMAWDPTRAQMLLVNGDPTVAGSTWTWNTTRWVRVAGGDLPPGTFLLGLDAEPGTGTLLAVGCCAESNGATTTWRWDGTSWARVTTSTVPAFAAGQADDPVSGHVLLFGDPSLAAGHEMWSWTRSDWTALTQRLPVFAEGAAADPADGHVVILGSFAEPVLGDPQPLHIWSWTGAAWRARA